MRKRGIIGFIVFVFIFLLFILSVGIGRAEKPILEKAITKDKVCKVGDYEANMKDERQRAYIMANHGDILSHAGIIPNKAKSVRDMAVRQGNRKLSGLSSCVECHRTKANFCDRCHDYVGVSSVSDKTGCFACHFYPDNENQLQKWQNKMEAIGQ